MVGINLFRNFLSVTPQWRVHSGELREMVPDSEYGEDYGGYETKPHEWTTKEHKWTTTPAQETWTTKEHKWTTTTSHPYHGKVKNEIVDFAVEKLKEKGELKNLYNNCGKDFRTVTDWFELVRYAVSEYVLTLTVCFYLPGS